MVREREVESSPFKWTKRAKRGQPPRSTEAREESREVRATDGGSSARAPAVRVHRTPATRASEGPIARSVPHPRDHSLSIEYLVTRLGIANN